MLWYYFWWHLALDYLWILERKISKWLFHNWGQKQSLKNWNVSSARLYRSNRCHKSLLYRRNSSFRSKTWSSFHWNFYLLEIKVLFRIFINFITVRFIYKGKETELYDLYSKIKPKLSSDRLLFSGFIEKVRSFVSEVSMSQLIVQTRD